MAQDLVLRILDECVADARIRFTVDDKQFVVGKGHRQEGDHCDVAIRVHDPRFFSRVLCYGNLGMGEAFIDGDF